MSEGTKECPYCGESINIMAKKCKHCGEWLEEKEALPSSQSVQLTADIGQAIPNEIRKWNWGAFLLSWIWGIRNKSYWTFLALIPYFGYLWIFVCGVKGNEWAWKNQKWESVEQFNNVQKTWAMWSGIIAGVAFLIGMLLAQ